MESYQIKHVTTADPDQVRANAKEAIAQLTSKTEVAPDGAKRIAQVTVANPANPLYHADEATLARRFAQEIRRLAPGESLVIRNAEGSHTFTPPESP